jgi:hypothetical protein
MPFRPANISLIHRRCPGPSAARAPRQTHQFEPGRLTLCSISDAWLKEHDRKPDGAAWEVYTWIDPGLEPDPSAWPAPSEWRTQLIQPIR